MNNPIKQPPLFVISVDADQNVVKAEMAESRAEADVIAQNGIGSINYIARPIASVDRLTPPPKDIAEAAISFLQEVVKGRRHSTSPQCIPMAQYRKLVEFAEQYARAQELQQGE
jgi:hypothetical protein